MLATQDSEIRRTAVQRHPRQIVHKTLSGKTFHKNKTGGVSQGVDPEFKPHYLKNKNKNKSILIMRALIS
jgi:hypothetical protein